MRCENREGTRDEANAWCAEIKSSSSRGMSYQMMQSCQHRQHTSDGEIAFLFHCNTLNKLGIGLVF